MVWFSGQQQGTSLFGQTPSPFGQPQQTPAFGQTPQASFGQTPQTSAFGQAGQSPLFGAQPQQASPFNQASGGLFGQPQSNPFQSQPAQQANMFSGSLTTQMAPVAPVVVPLPDREIQASVPSLLMANSLHGCCECGSLCVVIVRLHAWRHH